MSNAVDWDSAPEGAEFNGDGKFRKHGPSGRTYFFDAKSGWCPGYSLITCHAMTDYQPRPAPQEKPMKYEYGVEYPTNGAKPDLPDDVEIQNRLKFNGELTNVRKFSDVNYWHNVAAFKIVDERYKPSVPVEPKQPTTAAEYLAACAQVQLERGKQYDASGTGERSFGAAAEAFNCITGKQLRGSDVCLILELVKKVRQYSDPTRLHADSVLDAVSYGSLWAAELTKELK